MSVFMTYDTIMVLASYDLNCMYGRIISAHDGLTMIICGRIISAYDRSTMIICGRLISAYDVTMIIYGRIISAGIIKVYVV